MTQTGSDNPNWRGGPVSRNCLQCGKERRMVPAKAKTFKFCSRPCRAAWDKGRAGANSPIWKGGHTASKCRYRAKMVRPEPQPRPPRVSSRHCKACGKPGVRKGRRYHPECRPCPSNPLAPFRCSGCGVEKMIRLRPGRNQTYCRACWKKLRCGEKNGNWRGGITPLHRKLRNSEQYKEWRKAVFERDGYTCVWCGQKGGKLNADHIKPFCAFPELRFDVSNGRTLCIACHEKTDTYLSGALKYRDGCQEAAKLPGNKPTPDQQGFLQVIRNAGGLALVVHDIAELAAAIPGGNP